MIPYVYTNGYAGSVKLLQTPVSSEQVKSNPARPFNACSAFRSKRHIPSSLFCGFKPCVPRLRIRATPGYELRAGVPPNGQETTRRAFFNLPIRPTALILTLS